MNTIYALAFKGYAEVGGSRVIGVRWGDAHVLTMFVRVVRRGRAAGDGIWFRTLVKKQCFCPSFVGGRAVRGVCMEMLLIAD